jgi:hypothetical protein
MDYGQILGRSWRITWNNKFLWVLGFLAALTRASSNFNFNTSGSDMGPEQMEQVAQAMVALGLLCCLGLLIGLAVWLVSLAAKGGLISAVSRIDQGETVTLGEAFRAGTARIWTLVGMNLLLYLPLILIAVVSISAIVALLAGSGITLATLAEEPSAVESAIGGAFVLFIFCFCGLVCGLVLLGLFLQFINAFAYRGIMLRGLGAIESISHGWQVFRTNLGEVLLLSLLFLAISFGYGILIGIILFPLTLAFIVPMMALFSNGGGPGPAELFLLFGGALCLGVVSAALISILVTWQSAAFTLAYQEWTGRESKQFAVSSEM